MTIELAIVKDTVSPILRDLARIMTDATPLNRVQAKGVSVALKEHFRARDKVPNAKGWPKRGLYGDFAAATDVGEVDAAGATVVVAHPAINQRVFGGEIRPKRGRLLALPAMAAAYSAGSPREGATPALKMMMAYNPAIGHWMWSLMAVEPGTKQVKDRRKGHEGQMRTVVVKNQPAGIWYWLATKTNPPADPDALPSNETMAQAATAAALQFFNSRAYLSGSAA